MDIDQFLTRNSGSWARLEQLLKRAGHGARRLDPAELAELIRLYQRTSAHLSYASTNFSDPGLTMLLSRLVSQAGAVIYDFHGAATEYIRRPHQHGISNALRAFNGLFDRGRHHARRLRNL